MWFDLLKIWIEDWDYIDNICATVIFCRLLEFIYNK